MKQFFSFLFSVDSVWSRTLCILIYVLMYDFVYENFIFFFFEYMGVRYTPIESWSIYLLWLTTSIFPICFYRGLDNISSFFTLFLFYFGYIPIIHALFVTKCIPIGSACLFSLGLCIALSSFFHIKTERSVFRVIQLTPTIPLKYIEICTLVFSLLLFGVRAGQMHFVNILTDRSLLYQMRYENFDKAQSSFALLLYFQGWLGCTLYPFLMVCYLKSRQWFRFALIMLGNIFLFMLDMQKITFLMPFLMILLYYCLNNRKQTMGKRLHSLLGYSIVLFSVLLYLTSDNSIMFGIGSIILLRTVCVAGWLTQFYFAFFEFHPMTHYSHINIVNAITHEYPYSEPLGYAVAYGNQNANANFILTDGYAAWGFGGVVFICVVFYFLLHFINAICSRYRLTTLFVVLIPALSSILNVSLFTTLLTKGFFLMLIMLMATDSPLLIEKEQDATESSELQESPEKAPVTD